MFSRQSITALAVLTLSLMWGCSGSPVGPVSAPQSDASYEDALWASAASSDSTLVHDTSSTHDSTVTITILPMLPKKKGVTKYDFNALGGTSATSSTVLLKRTAGGSLNLRVNKRINPNNGGTLTNMDATVTVPSGALSSAMNFSIRVPNTGFQLYELGPHGTVFNVPVTLTVSYANADLSTVDESTIRIAFLNPNTGAWMTVNGVRDSVNMTVTAQLKHFSTYGLVSDVKLVDNDNGNGNNYKGWPR